MNSIISAIVIFCTHLLEGITGFGSTVLALPFLNVTIGLRIAVQLLCVLSWSMALYIVLHSWKNILWKEFLFIVLWAGLGMPLGIWLFDKLPGAWLCVFLGMFMIVVGIRGEIATLKSKQSEAAIQPAKRTLLMKLLLLGGGIIQGAFGTGGPFVVIYSSKALPDKRVFRVTLSLLWLSTNSIRLLKWAVSGELWNRELGSYLLWAFPVMLAGVLLGDYLHNKVSEHLFKVGVYAILVLSGIFMAVNNAINI